MSRSRSNQLRAWVALALLAPAAQVAWAQAGSKYPNIGRAATQQEVAAWDIDVRPDFKGLPKGSGTVAAGQVVWEAKCASCHGVFGESNTVFSPLVGGTSESDVKTGHVARLKEGGFPGRTTLMKLATVSSLWDYINRAMPWAQPKSLSADEVYAVTAFLLQLGGVIPDDFVLSDTTMPLAQARLPNRNGMTQKHALWPGKELGGEMRPDTSAAACMTNCGAQVKVTSHMPDHARNSHGNLAEQNRLFVGLRGADTTLPEVNRLVPAASTAPTVPTAANVAVTASEGAAAPGKPVAAPATLDARAAMALAGKYTCTACHGLTQKIVGPGFADVGKKYPGQVNYLMEKIVKGSTGVWGQIPMPAQSLPAADARALALWLADGAPK